MSGFDDVVKSTGTDLVWLVLLAFSISRGMIKTGLGRRVGLLFMRWRGRRTIGLGYGLATTELVVAPAMPSITARAGGVLLPITRAIAEILGSRADDGSRIVYVVAQTVLVPVTLEDGRPRRLRPQERKVLEGLGDD